MCEIYGITLKELPSEILLSIFKHLAISDLLNLKLTCWRFNSIVNNFWDEIVWTERANFLVTNQLTEQMRKRCQGVLIAFQKHRISENWKIGRYGENKLFLFPRSMPSVHLEKDGLWFGRGNHIRCYERMGPRLNLRKIKHNLGGFDRNNVCKFVVRNDCVVCGNGSNLRVYSLETEKYVSDLHLRHTEITSVDVSTELIAIGSRDNKLYLYQNIRNSSPIFKHEHVFHDRLWSVALKDGELAIGTAANCSLTSLIIYDTENCKTQLELDTGKKGAGILNIIWESPSLLWTGGYDSVLRKWDLRIGKNVQNFTDPWFSKIYSFDYDYLNTMITGCEGNGRTVLWDTRKDKYVQIYYMKSCNRSSSPVYSLSFDAESLFAITDAHLNILDFSVFHNRRVDSLHAFFREGQLSTIETQM